MYENADLATDFLRSDAPCSLHGYLQHCNETMWPLFSHLESAVQEGTSQREKAFSKQMLQVAISDFCVIYLRCWWEHIQTHLLSLKETSSSSREGKLRFMKAMHNIAKITGKTIATAFDLSTYKSACDLGGKKRMQNVTACHWIWNHCSTSFVLIHCLRVHRCLGLWIRRSSSWIVCNSVWLTCCCRVEWIFPSTTPRQLGIICSRSVVLWHWKLWLKDCLNHIRQSDKYANKFRSICD